MSLESLTRYRSHKVVRAAKIISISAGMQGLQGFQHRLALKVAEGILTHVDVSAEWLHEKRAEAGGYYVLYDDNYASFSPAKAFEEGYTALSDPS